MDEWLDGQIDSGCVGRWMMMGGWINEWIDDVLVNEWTVGG